MTRYSNNSLVLKHPPICNCFALKWRTFWRIPLRIFWILSALCIITLLLFYIFQVNAGVAERYLIQKYEGRLSGLLEENQNLKTGSVEVNSLDNIIAQLEEFNFEKVDKVYYIQALDTQVVAK